MTADLVNVMIALIVLGLIVGIAYVMFFFVIPFFVVRWQFKRKGK